MTEQRNYDRTDYVTEKRPKIEQIEHDRAEDRWRSRETMTEQIERDRAENADKAGER